MIDKITKAMNPDGLPADILRITDKLDKEELAILTAYIQERLAKQGEIISEEITPELTYESEEFKTIAESLNAENEKDKEQDLASFKSMIEYYLEVKSNGDSLEEDEYYIDMFITTNTELDDKNAAYFNLIKRLNS